MATCRPRSRLSSCACAEVKITMARLYSRLVRSKSSLVARCKSQIAPAQFVRDASSLDALTVKCSAPRDDGGCDCATRLANCACAAWAFWSTCCKRLVSDPALRDRLRCVANDAPTLDRGMNVGEDIFGNRDNAPKPPGASTFSCPSVHGTSSSPPLFPLELTPSSSMSSMAMSSSTVTASFAAASFADGGSGDFHTLSAAHEAEAVEKTEERLAAVRIRREALAAARRNDERPLY